MAYVVDNSNRQSAPEWLADFGSRDHLALFPAKLLASAFNDLGGVYVEVTANAAADATSVSVVALAQPIPAGAVLDFGGKKFARLTAEAAIGATSLTVAALATALADGDITYWSEYGRKMIKSGTLVGRTYAERDANTPFGPAVDTDDEIYLVAFDIENANDENDCELVEHGTRIKENYLPDWTVISANANLLADLRANYECFKGVN